MSDKPKPDQNPSQPIIDAHNNRTRIIGELASPRLSEEDRTRLHGELRDAEEAYSKSVQDLAGPKKR